MITLWPVLLGLLWPVSDVYGLDCYHCESIANLTDCHNVVVCPSDSICALDIDSSDGHDIYHLTCKPKSECSSTENIFVGRRSAAGCSQCCDEDACNKHLCSAAIHAMPCASDEVCIDLDKTGTVTGSIPGVTTQASVGPTHGMACSRRGLFRAEFDRLSNDPSLLCYNGTYTEQQLLRIQMTLTAQRYNHFLDIGDSVSNDGFAGDSGHSDFAAEVDGYSMGFTVYANSRDREDDCHAHRMYSFTQGPNSTWIHVTIWIANHFFKFNNNHDVDESHCDKCLFGLNGQTDKRAHGIADQFIYMGLNRVIHSESRTGYGLCNVRMKWVDNTNTP